MEINIIVVINCRRKVIGGSRKDGFGPRALGSRIIVDSRSLNAGNNELKNQFRESSVNFAPQSK